MKKLLLPLALLASLVVPVLAQDIQPDGTGNCINRRTGQRVDCTTGAVLSADPSAPAWGTYWNANAVNDTFTVHGSLLTTASFSSPFSFDSTVVMPFNAAGYKTLTLYMRSIPPYDSTAADSTSQTRWGIQIRKHPTSAADTSNTAIWWQWAGATTGASQTGAGADSATTVGFTYPRADEAGAGCKAYPGERLFVFDDHLGGTGTARAGASMTGPPMIAVDVQGAHGEVFTAPYVSIRVHCIARSSLASGNPSRRPRFILGVWMGQ